MLATLETAWLIGAVHALVASRLRAASSPAVAIMVLAAPINCERTLLVGKSKLSLPNQQITLTLMMLICAVWLTR